MCWIAIEDEDRNVRKAERDIEVLKVVVKTKDDNYIPFFLSR